MSPGIAPVGGEILAIATQADIGLARGRLDHRIGDAMLLGIGFGLFTTIRALENVVAVGINSVKLGWHLVKR